MSIRTLVTLLFVTVVTAHASAQTCVDVFRPGGIKNGKAVESLTPDLTAAIKDMKLGDYTVSLHTIRIGGRERLVVMAGETHIKAEDDTRRFVAVMQHFNAKAVEGLTTDRHWFSDKLDPLLDHAQTRDLGQGSSIDTVETESSARGLEQSLARRFNKSILDGNNTFEKVSHNLRSGKYFRDLRETAINTPREKLRNTPPTAFTLATIEQLDADRIIGQLSQLLQGDAADTIHLPSDFHTRIFQLEKDYIPSISEKTAGAIAILSHKLRLSSLKDLALVRVAAVSRRDYYMIQSLTDVLEQNPEIEKILVVVGHAHVPGMSLWLREKGSTEIVLEEDDTAFLLKRLKSRLNLL